ncbi:hypothetical protein LZ31DRAFT_388834 [Colletotrichum somersetense]|nr:hypothetical protein LZ31DRAFT_388834 [Colletotrichum somersetense]
MSSTMSPLAGFLKKHCNMNAQAALSGYLTAHSFEASLVGFLRRSQTRQQKSIASNTMETDAAIRTQSFFEMTWGLLRGLGPNLVRLLIVAIGFLGTRLHGCHSGVASPLDLRCLTPRITRPISSMNVFAKLPWRHPSPRCSVTITGLVSSFQTSIE